MRGLLLAVIVVIGLGLIADRFDRDVISTPPRVARTSIPRPTVTTRPTFTPRPALTYASALTPHIVSFEESANAVLDALNAGASVSPEQAQAALATLATIRQLDPPADMRRFHDAVYASLSFCAATFQAVIDGDIGMANAVKKMCSAGMYSATEVINDMARRVND